MKWDIDKALKPLEPESCPGTIIQRVMMDVKLFAKNGLKPVPPKLELDARGQKVLVPPQSVMVWCLCLGFIMEPKAAFYGHTIRECFLKARKAVKADALAAATAWGVQRFKPVLKKAKPKVKKSSKPRRKEQDT